MQIEKAKEKSEKRRYSLFTVRCSLFIILCLLLAVTCSLDNTPLLDPPPPGYGYFSLKTDGNVSQRTILPQTVQDNFLAYTLVFTLKGETDVIETIPRTNDTLGDNVTLRVGSWDLVVTAYMDAARTQPAATGILNDITITEGMTSNDNVVVLNAIMTTGTGSFNWNIIHPDNAAVKITITPRAGTSGSQIIIDNAEKVDTATRTGIPVGQYDVLFELTLENHRTVRRIEVMRVYQNMTSRFPETGSFDFNSYFISSVFEIDFNTNSTDSSGVNSHNVIWPETFKESVEKSSSAALADYIPTREGYIFDGWYTDNNTFDVPFSINTPVNRDYTLYANWVSVAVTTTTTETTYLNNKTALQFSSAPVLTGNAVSYQWQRSADQTTWTNVSIDESYTPPSDLSAGTHYYRCVVTNTGLNDGLTSTAYSNTVTLTVNPAPITSATIIIGGNAAYVPVRGAAPSTNISITPEPVNFSYEPKVWYDPEGGPVGDPVGDPVGGPVVSTFTFRPGTKYTAIFEMTANENYTFPSTFTATINGVAAQIANPSATAGSNKNRTDMWFEFPATDPAVLTIKSISGPAELTAGSISGSLSIEAEIDEAGAGLSYRWVKTTDPGTTLSSTSSYELPEDLPVGTHTYQCFVTGDFGAGTTSRDITVIVQQSTTFNITYTHITEGAPVLDETVTISRTGTGGLDTTAKFEVETPTNYSSIQWLVNGVQVGAIGDDSYEIDAANPASAYNAVGVDHYLTLVVVPVGSPGVMYEVTITFRVDP